MTPVRTIADKSGVVRVMAEECATCIFKPVGETCVRLGRLRDIIEEAVKNGGAIICHKTLPTFITPNSRPAMCRGFFDRYQTTATQVAKFFGIREVGGNSDGWRT